MISQSGESIPKPWRMQSRGASRRLMAALQLVFLVVLSTIYSVDGSKSGFQKNMLGDTIQNIMGRGRIRKTLAQSTPALTSVMSVYTEKNGSSRMNRRHASLSNSASVSMVSSVKVQSSSTKKRVRSLLDAVGSTGFYYGIDAQRMIPNRSRQRKPRPPKLEESMVIAIEELKMMRQEMEQMRIEMQQLKRKMLGDDASFQIDDHATTEMKEKALQKRRKEADKLAAEIESWANDRLQEGEEEGWIRVECSKMVRASVNGTGRTQAFMKWMVDPRGEKADKEDFAKHPCIKCESVIDAPPEIVCLYLSQEEAFPRYNDVVDNYKDLEEISPHAKICWSSSPQILFVKPRDFVTFCHHRWKPDGTQVIVNQACEHPKYPLEKMEKEGKSCRGYALRGANFISRCPEDPTKTRITIVAHCRPGGGLPEWATKTAVKTLAPLEPFKLFHKINQQIAQDRAQLQARLKQAEETVSKMPPGTSSRPGGFAQIGYACFWPKGGGKEELTGINDFSPVDNNRNGGENDID